MKKLLSLALLAMLMLAFASCHHTETYAEQKERELTAINKFLVEDGINVISEETFKAQNYTTDLKRNEFVLFDNIERFISDSSFVIIGEDQFKEQGEKTVGDKQFVYLTKSGVYMQIVRQGCGEVLRDGETATVLCRFVESNLMLGADSVTLTNISPIYRNDGTVTNPDLIVEKMIVTNTQGTFNGIFDLTSLMYQNYQSQVVPQGWLVPFSYIKLGRPSKADDEIAKVRLIVPHDQGNLAASRNVVPFYYEITFERGR